MLRHHLRLIRLALLLADGAVAVALFVLVSRLRLGEAWTGAWETAGAPWTAWALAYGAAWMGVIWLHQLDQLRSRWTLRGEFLDILRAVLTVAVVVFSLLFLVHAPEVSRLFLLALFVAQLVVSVVQRLGYRAFLVTARRREVGTRNVVVLGTGPVAHEIAMRLEAHPALGYRITGFMGQPSPSCPRVLGPLDDVEAVVHANVVDELVAALSPDELPYLEPVTALALLEGKRLRVVLQPGVVPVSGGRIERLGSHEIVTVSNAPDRLLALAAKRLIDVVVAALVLVVLSPFILVMAASIWLEDRGPVFFRQTRVGLHGRYFRIVKLRTMHPEAEQQLADLAELNEIEGQAFKLSADPRVTRVGWLLRRTSLDELPQFWNVLLGQMSVVGPRPPLPEEIAVYDLWQRRRLSMKPGITGLWQVSARSHPEFDRWVELDLDYIDRWSLWLDLKIMARTPPAMFSGR
jgi:exopolysaccharide biosynthesis polyprenyl glycosylphosphotransferase